MAEEGDDLSGAAEFAAQASSETSDKKERQQQSIPKEKSTSREPDPVPKPASKSKPELPTGDRIFASPVAKKIALERGIPLSQLKGSGPSGRIVREDVEKYKSSASSSRPSATEEEYKDTPLSNMRRVIGQRLTQSKQELPHYYLTVDISMDKVLKLREVFNRSLAEKEKTAKLSVNDFIVKAAACALADVPEANSAWLGEVIRT